MSDNGLQEIPRYWRSNWQAFVFSFDHFGVALSAERTTVTVDKTNAIITLVSPCHLAPLATLRNPETHTLVLSCRDCNSPLSLPADTQVAFDEINFANLHLWTQNFYDPFRAILEAENMLAFLADPDLLSQLSLKIAVARSSGSSGSWGF